MKTTQIALLGTILASLLPSASFAASAPYKGPTAEQAVVLYKPCEKLTENQQKERCKSRQLTKWYNDNPRLPKNAMDLYNRLDVGGNQLRARLQQERKDAYAEDAKTRKTYSQWEPEDNHNTQKAPYLNDLRQQRLDCMYEAPGRARSRCFDQLKAASVRTMRESWKLRNTVPE